MQSNKDIVRIQSVIRGKQDRQLYRINDLPIDECESNETFVVGNDPYMPENLNAYTELKDKIALVATSGIRAVSLACKLGNPDKLPKIFLLDYSYRVTEFWKKTRDFMSDDTKAGTVELFKMNLAEHLNKNRYSYKDLSKYDFRNGYINDIKYPPQKISDYFEEIINAYGYDYVRSVILHASIFTQSWETKNTFIKIKNILNFLGINKIFLYPSNIIHCTPDEKEQNRILKNIQLLNPLVSIHTDRCEIHELPEHVFLIENQEPTSVRSTLFASSCVKPESQMEHLLQMYLDNLESEMNAKGIDIDSIIKATI